MTDIFSLDNLDDLPVNLKAELKILSRDDFEKRVIELFLVANRPLNVDEVTVGLFRKFREERPRASVARKLYNMTRGAHASLNSLGSKKGVYDLRIDGDDRTLF